MIMECTDCTNCASFDFGWRIVCLHKDLPADHVYLYQPLGDRDAESCKGFEDGMPHEFTMNDFVAAEKTFVEGVEDEISVRTWVEKNEKNEK